MEILKKLRVGDIIIIIIVIILSIVTFLITFNNNEVNTVNIYQNNNLIQSLPLNINTTIQIDEEFSNTIIIENNKVRVINSTCPDKLCENFGNSHTIICAPNKLLIEIMGNNSDFDVIV